MKSKYVITIIALIAILALVGCAQTAATVDTSKMEAAISGTLSVMQTQVANANAAKATAAIAEPTDAVPTATLEPSATATPMTVETTEVVPTVKVISISDSSTPLGPSWRVGHVQDLNFEDGSFVDVGLAFNKQWKVSNIGTATWPADTKLVSVDDNPFNASDDVTIGQVVSPGQSVTLKINLRCSSVAATYTGRFMLENPSGVRFGIGSNFDDPFWVKVVCHD